VDPEFLDQICASADQIGITYRVAQGVFPRRSVYRYATGVIQLIREEPNPGEPPCASLLGAPVTPSAPVGSVPTLAPGQPAGANQALDTALKPFLGSWITANVSRRATMRLIVTRKGDRVLLRVLASCDGGTSYCDWRAVPAVLAASGRTLSAGWSYPGQPGLGGIESITLAPDGTLLLNDKHNRNQRLVPYQGQDERPESVVSLPCSTCVDP
jgi:hypothetical protein